MELPTVTAEFLAQVKTKAASLKKSKGLKQREALDRVSQDDGFLDYDHLKSLEEKPIERFCRILAEERINPAEDSHVGNLYWAMPDLEFQSLLNQYQLPMGPEHPVPHAALSSLLDQFVPEYRAAVQNTVISDVERSRILSDIYRNGIQFKDWEGYTEEKARIDHIIKYVDSSSFLSERQLDVGDLFTRPPEHNLTKRLRREYANAFMSFLFSAREACDDNGAYYHPNFEEFMHHWTATLPDHCDHDVKTILTTRYPAPKHLNMEPGDGMRVWKHNKEAKPTKSR